MIIIHFATATARSAHMRRKQIHRNSIKRKQYVSILHIACWKYIFIYYNNATSPDHLRCNVPPLFAYADSTIRTQRYLPYWFHLGLRRRHAVNRFQVYFNFLLFHENLMGNRSMAGERGWWGVDDDNDGWRIVPCGAQKVGSYARCA